MFEIEDEAQDYVIVTTWPDRTPVTASDDSWEVAHAWGYAPVAVEHDREHVHIWESH